MSNHPTIDAKMSNLLYFLKSNSFSAYNGGTFLCFVLVTKFMFVSTPETVISGSSEDVRRIHGGFSSNSHVRALKKRRVIKEIVEDSQY